MYLFEFQLGMLHEYLKRQKSIRRLPTLCWCLIKSLIFSVSNFTNSYHKCKIFKALFRRSEDLQLSVSLVKYLLIATGHKNHAITALTQHERILLLRQSMKIKYSSFAKHCHCHNKCRPKLGMFTVLHLTGSLSEDHNTSWCIAQHQTPA